MNTLKSRWMMKTQRPSYTRLANASPAHMLPLTQPELSCRPTSQLWSRKTGRPGASQRALVCEGWLQGAWPNNTGQPSRRLARHFSMPCPLGQVQIALVICSVPLQIWAATLPSCPLTVLGLTTTSAEQPCSENLCPCLEPRPYFPGSGFRTRNLPHTCGGTIRGWCTTYLRARAESKATPLCLCSLLWAFTIHSRRSRPTSSRMNTFALFWTTSILSVLLKELGPFSIYCNDICTR